MTTARLLLFVIIFKSSLTILAQEEKFEISNDISSDSTGDLDATKGKGRPDRYKTTNEKLLKDNYFIVYDGLYDMHGTAQNLFTISRLFGRGIDQISCRYDKNTREYKCVGNDGLIGRIFLDGVFNLLFVDWLSTVQHEYNGHGFRIREDGVSVNKYYVNPAFFSNKARVDFNFSDLSFYSKILYSTGGPESNTIFSREAFRYGLQKDYFSHYYTFSYLLKLDLPMYILGGTEVGSYYWNNGWGDVAKYCMTFDSVSDFTKVDIYKEAKKGAYISLLDPSMLLAFYQYIKDYIIKGNSHIKSPMIKIKNVTTLPFVDYHLSPYGFEYYAGSYLKIERKLFELYYRWSYGHIHGESFGFGLYASNLLQYNRFNLDAFIDFWHQDFNILYYGTDSTKYYKKTNSAKVALLMHYRISNSFNVSGQIGYKGEGFLLGNPIDKGFSYKIAFGAYF